MEKYKIKDICTVLNGRAYKYEELQDSGKYRILRVGNFFSKDDWYYSDMELEDNKYCYNGDLLYAWSANFGPKIWNGEKTIYHYHIWKMVPNENVDKLFLYYKLFSITDRLKDSSHGSVMLHLTKSDMENFVIELPTLTEQRKIGKILKDIDDKIELNNEINNNLFEVVLNDFNDFLDKNTYSEMVKLEDCVEKINTGADAIQRAPIVDYDTGIRCIRIGDMTNGRDYHSWGFTKMTDKDFENYKLIRNDIVITRTAVNGLTYMITDEENTVCNNGNIRLRVNNKYNPLYIYLNTKTKDFRNYIDRINSETSVRPNMKVEYFTSYEIKKIDLEKQNDFCNRAESIMKKIQNNKVENYNLEQLRDTLLPKLMNGEIDLDNIEM